MYKVLLPEFEQIRKINDRNHFYLSHYSPSGGSVISVKVACEFTSFVITANKMVLRQIPTFIR